MLPSQKDGGHCGRRIEWSLRLIKSVLKGHVQERDKDLSIRPCMADCFMCSMTYFMITLVVYILGVIVIYLVPWISNSCNAKFDNVFSPSVH